MLSSSCAVVLEDAIEAAGAIRDAASLLRYHDAQHRRYMERLIALTDAYVAVTTTGVAHQQHHQMPRSDSPPPPMALAFGNHSATDRAQSERRRCEISDEIAQCEQILVEIAVARVSAVTALLPCRY